MLPQRILLVLTGEAFRHVNGPLYVNPENFNDQKVCSYSHRRFIQRIAPIKTDVFVNTYRFNDEYDAALRSWYPDAIRYTVNDKLLGEYGIIDDTYVQLRQMDLSPYTAVLFIRIDLFVREYFLSVFNINEDWIMYTHLDSNKITGKGHNGNVKGPYPGVCHNIVFVPKEHFPLIVDGIVWKRHESANLAVTRTHKIKFFINTFCSCNTASEWNPIYAMAGRDEPQFIYERNRGERFNWITLETTKIPNDHRFDYLMNRDTRAQWKSNPEGLLAPKKRVVIYANCQGRAVRDILAYHSDLSEEYDIFRALVINNYTYMNTKSGLPYDILGQADLFIYQPISSERGQYSTVDLLKTLKPECKTLSFPYLYNYSFWEVLAMSDADYDIGVFGMKYAHLNQKPISDLRDAGFSFEEIERRIRANQIDWKFGERFEKTQEILREKEKECDVKVADFIDAHHKTHLLFYTQNHPSLFFLRFVAQRILEKLGHNPDILPDENHLQHPDYNIGQGNFPHYEMGYAAWKHFGFKFIPQPGSHVTDKIVSMARRIYDHRSINTSQDISIL